MKKRKLFLIALTLIMSTCFLFAFVGCNKDSQCAHEWQNTSVGTDATCTEVGSQEQKCTKCGGTQTIELPVLGHNTDGTIAHKDADCTNGGVVGGTYCTRCDEGKAAAEATITALGHMDENKDHICDRENCGATVGVHQAAEGTHVCDYCNQKASEHTGGTATCKTQAECSVCHEKYGDLDLTNHEKGLVWTRTATTHKHTYECCGAVSVAEEAHEWENGVCTECEYVCEHTGGEATCTEQATCTVCGEKYGNSLGHNSDGKVAHKDADCTNDGVVGGTYCTRCDEGKAAAEATIPAKGHTFTQEKAEDKYLKSVATETSPAIYYKSCAACGKSSQGEVGEATFESGSAIVHNYTAETVEDKYLKSAATCTSPAIYYKACADCGKSSQGEVGEATFERGNATGHDYGDLITAVPVTCLSDGNNAYYHCKACDSYFDENKNVTTWDKITIKSNGHNFSDGLVHQPATCTQSGYDDYYYCGVCKTYFDAEKVATTLYDLEQDAIEHINNEYFDAKDATCIQEGNAEYLYCPDCKNYLDIDFNILSWDDIVIAKVDHTYGTLVHNPATCTTDGYNDYYQCAECSKYFDSARKETTLTALAVSATGHHYIDTVYEASCSAPGYTEHVCTCGDTYTDAVVAKLDHSCNDLDICSMCNKKIFELFYTLSTDETYYIISGIKHGKTATTFEIPAEYEGKPVKEIATSAFDGNTRLTSVTIPTSITTIGEKAFYNCTSLNVTLSGAKESSSNGKYCYNTESQLSNIGSYAFSNTAITSIALPEALSVINEGVFDGCTKLEVTFHGYITQINDYAFRNTAVTALPSLVRLEKLGVSVFEGCNKLTSVVITFNTDSATIGARAFAGCGIEGELIIPYKVKTIGKEAFMDCTKITKLTVSSYTNKDVCLKTINSKAFFGCTSLKEASIKRMTSTGSIGGAVFGGCTSLTDLTLPCVGSAKNKADRKKEQNIFGYIFGDADDIGSISRDGLTEVEQFYNDEKTEKETFYIPSSLKRVVIAEDKYIWYGAFSNCTMIESISILSGTIKAYAFEGCTNLKILDIQKSGNGSPIGIEEHAFDGLSNLKELYIKNVKKDTTYGTLVMPVTNLLGSCTSLEVLEIPIASANKFYDYFSNAATDASVVPKSLKTVTVRESDNGRLRNRFFEGCSGITDVTVGEDITVVAMVVFKGCTSLKKIVISNGVTNIEKWALEGCSALESLTIPFVGTYLDTKEDGYIPNFGAIFGDSEYEDSYKDCYYTAKKLGDYASTTDPYYYLPKTLTSVTITGGTVKEYAFSYCTSITTLGFKDLTFEKNAFSYCSNLENLYLYGNNFKVKGSHVIFYNGKPKNLYVESLETWLTMPYANLFKSSSDSHIYVGGELLSGTVVIPGSVTDVYGYVFSGILDITGVKFEEGVKTINNSAFDRCKNITSVTLPGTLEEIGASVFYDCVGITDITLPDGIKWIGDYAFGVKDGNTGGLENINLPTSLEYIGPNVFKNQTKLVNVTGPANLAEKDLLPATVTHLTITSGTLSNLNNLPALVSLTLADGVVGIGENVCISGCGELTTLNIGKDVATWTDGAFSSCSKLQTITVSADNTYFKVVNNALYSIDGNTKYLSAKA